MGSEQFDTGLLEDVPCLAGHADPRETRLYERRRKVTRNVVERISVKGLPPMD